MQKSFVLGQSNEVIKEGKLYDLHNFYLLESLSFQAREGRLKIAFAPLSDMDGPVPPVSLVFKSVDHLEMSCTFGQTQGAMGLEEMGYKSPGDVDDEWLLREEQSGPNDHLFLRLEKNAFIRVHSQFADLEEPPKPRVLR